MKPILTTDLYEKVLVNPLLDNAKINRLLIVSGYATSAMSFHHLSDILERNQAPCSVELIVGMTASDGISASNHQAFMQLVEKDLQGHFSCRYIAKQAPTVHSKLYIWCAGNKPTVAFTGSANYSQTAFLQDTRRCEAMAFCDPVSSLAYYQKLLQSTALCGTKEAEAIVGATVANRRKKPAQPSEAQVVAKPAVAEQYADLPYRVLTLLDRNGQLPQSSGLNWGQRPLYKREPNQAYIKLEADVYRSDFFPPRTLHFTVLTDDGKIMICSRAQENAKAIHTPHDNSIIGRYFRKRLGLASGARVTTEDLIKYGRTDVAFYKINDESYYMDFSVSHK